MPFLTVGAERIAYHHLKGRAPGIVFLGGFMSNMQGTKALALEAFACEQGLQFTRFDYSGHGESSGAFENGTIGAWRNQALAVLDDVAEGEQILVGSSMGGWLMLLLALARPEKVRGLVGLASAPDFTERLIWQAFTPAQQTSLMQDGRVMIQNCMPNEADYPITKGLIEEARQHLLLDEPIAIACPVHLIHGIKDKDVPFEMALELANKLKSDRVRISLQKSGDHRLSSAEDIALLHDAVLSMRETVIKL